MRVGGEVMRVSTASDTRALQRDEQEARANIGQAALRSGVNSQSAPDRNHVQMTEIERNLLSVSEKAMLEAIERANKSVTGGDTRFEFSIHEKTKQIMVKVIDEESNEIIRQIPPEKVLDIIAGIWDVAGLFVDERR